MVLYNSMIHKWDSDFLVWFVYSIHNCTFVEGNKIYGKFMSRYTIGRDIGLSAYTCLCTLYIVAWRHLTFPREDAGKRKRESSFDLISLLSYFSNTAIRMIFQKGKSSPTTPCINYFDVFSLHLEYDTKSLMSSIRLLVWSLCLSSFSLCQLLSHFLCFKHAGLLPVPRLGQAASSLRTFKNFCKVLIQPILFSITHSSPKFYTYSDLTL